MAVFPERIVLKSSTDGDSLVQAEIGALGESPIVPGEIVISRENGTVNLFALDINNNVVSASVPELAALTDVDLDDYSTIPNSSVLVFDEANQSWTNAPAPPYSISGNSLDDLGDVDLQAVVVDKDYLVWDGTANRWTNASLTPFSLTTDEYEGTPLSGQVLRYNADLRGDVETEPGEGGESLDPVGWEVVNLDYNDILNRPTALSDLVGDLAIGDLSDVSSAIPSLGDLLHWDGDQWIGISPPPVDITNGFLAQLADVSEVSLVSGAVPVYNVNSSTYEVKLLDYASIVGAPTAVSQLTADVGVSHWTNDAGYITNTEGLSSDSLSDFAVTDAQEGQTLIYRSGFWVNEYGPPANISMSRIGELLDVTYYQPGVEPGVLTIDNMGTLAFDSPLSGSGYTQQLTYDVEYGLGMTFLRDIDSSGSAVYVERGRGVTLRADVNIVRLSGRPSTTDNRPELRFETGDSGADVGTGEYISLKMPPVVSESVIYYLPGADGDVGDVLATDGTGNLAWVTQASTPALGDLSDVDLVTIPPTGGETLIYNVVADTWIPGTVADVDLSGQSIDALSDVDTTSILPQDGEGLVFYSATGLWAPGTVSDVDLSAESIDSLADVDTSSEGHIPTDGQVLTWHESMGHWMPMDATGGGGGGASEIVVDSAVTTAGHASFSAIGKTGILVEIGCDVDAWITLYPTAAARSADTGRLFDADPAPGSGVLSEAYIEASDFVLATPGTVYFNNDFPTADSIYVSARTSDGVLIDNANVLVTAYPMGSGGGGGGGGGVDSVNGKTGTVSLDIQDMDDFELVSMPPVTRTWIGKWYRSSTGNNACQADTFLGGDSDGAIMSREDIDGNDYESTVTGIANGSTLYVRVNSGAWQEFILDDSQSTNCSSAKDSFVIESTVLKTVVDNTTANDLIEISDGTDVATEVQLVDGDILKWVDADQKFKPAQAKDRIQGMDDFELSTGVVPSQFLFETFVSGSAAAGQWGTTSLRWGATDSRGAAWTASGAATYWFSSDGVNWEEVAAEVVYYAVDDYYYIQNPTAIETLIVSEGWTQLHINVDDPEGLAPELPLAQGDVLQWNNADQKFKPAQLPATIDKATLQAEVAASVDFADFQSRIAAL